MKKIIAFALAAMMSVSLLSGCEKKEESGAKLYDFITLEDSLANELYGIATEKNNTVLRDEIQNALNASIKEGSAGKIAEKWFGSNTIYIPKTPTVTTDPNAKSEKDTVVLGCDINFAPMGFKQGDDIVGFDIDLAKLIIEEKMGKTLKIQPITWSNKEAELTSGKVDVLWNGLTITDARQAAMCFTDAYMENKQVIVVPKDSEIKSSADLKGKKIAMQKESTAVEAFKNSGIEANVTELKDNVACLNELKTNRMEAVIMDSVVADYYLAKTK